MYSNLNSACLVEVHYEHPSASVKAHEGVERYTVFIATFVCWHHSWCYDINTLLEEHYKRQGWTLCISLLGVSVITIWLRKIEDYLIWGRRIDQHSCTSTAQTRDWKLSIVAEQVTEAQKPLCKWPCSQLLATCIASAQQEVVSSVRSVWCSLHLSVVVYPPLWYTQLLFNYLFEIIRNYAWLHLNALLKLHADVTFFYNSNRKRRTFL